MNGVRISIVNGMMIVALAAFDCLALRWLYVRGSRSILVVLGLLPIVDLLAIGAWLGARDLIRRRRSSSFQVGFQAFGWAAVAIYTVVCVSASGLDVGGIYLENVLAPVDWLVRRLGGVYDDSSFAWRLFSDICTSVALSMPLVAFAWVGGRLTRRFEVWLARGPWFRSDETRQGCVA